MAQPIRVEITGDSKGLTAAVGQANASLRKLEGESKQASQSLSNIDKGFSNLTKATAAVGGLYAVTAGVRDVTRAASELQQSSGAIDAVFKGQAASMQAAADASVDLGLSTADYGNLAVRLGSQLKNLGLGQDEVTSQTQRLIEVGADFAAMYGGTANEAVEALSATLRGEYDPAERYGLSIRKSAVDAEMASKGISQAQATINLILAQGADALGQWDRESDTFAVKQQKMQAEIENTKAKLGEALLPIMTQGASLAGDLAAAFGAIPTPLVTATVAVGGLVVGKKLLTAATARATAALTAYELKVQTAARGTSLLGVAAGSAATKMGAIGKAAGVAAVAYIGWEQASGKAGDSLRQQVMSTEKMTEAITKQGKSIKDLNIDLSEWGLATPLIDDQIESWEALRQVFDQNAWEKGKNVLGEIFSLGKGEGTVERTAAVEWLNNVKASLEGLPADEARAQWAEMLAEFERSGASADAVAEAQKFMADALREGETAAEAQARSMAEVNDAYSESKKAVDEFSKALLSLTDPFFRQQEAAASLIATIQGLSFAPDAIDQATGKFNLFTESGRAADKSARDLALGTIELVAAMKQNNVSAEEQAAVMQSSRDAFIQQATAMGLSGEAAAALADQYGLIPDRVETTVIAETASAQANAAALFATYGAIPAEYVTGFLAQVDQAQANVNALLAEYGLTPQEWTTLFDAFTSGAETDVGVLQRKYGLTPTQWDTLFAAATTGAAASTAALQQLYGLTDEQVSTLFQAFTSGSSTAVAELQRQYGLTDPEVETLFKALTGDATAAVNEFGRAADYAARPRTTVISAVPGGDWQITQQGNWNFGGLGGRSAPSYPTLPDARGVSAAAQQPLTAPDGKRIGKIRPKPQPPTVNVFVDGQRAPARVVTDPWSPHTAGVS